MASRCSRSPCRSTTSDWSAADPLPQIVERFHRRHEALYTYAMPDQESVLVNARVTVSGILEELPREPSLPPSPPAAPARRAPPLPGRVGGGAGLPLRRARAGAAHRRPGGDRVGDDDRAAAPRRHGLGDPARLARHRDPVGLSRSVAAASTMLTGCRMTSLQDYVFMLCLKSIRYQHRRRNARFSLMTAICREVFPPDQKPTAFKFVLIHAV